MSSSLNFYDGSCSTFDSNFIEFDEWEERIVDQNKHIDRIVEDVVCHIPSISIQPTDHTSRASRRYIECIREKGHDNVFEQYFAPDPIYTPEIFRRRFCMQKPLFERIMNNVVAADDYFQQSHDATGRLGMSSIQKCTVAMRVLTYGTAANLHDEYLRMSAAVIRKSLIKFVEGVISNFGDEYLRKPTEEDTRYLLQVGEQRSFPRMLGSINCMHWEWKNCPKAWVGQYGGRKGSRNDINVFNHSPIFKDVLEGHAPKVSYVVNGQQRKMGYYLTDGIYPKWAAFVKSIIAPQIQKDKLFAQHQEAALKDVERAFGVLQAHFSFIKRPCLLWDRDVMAKIMIACIIMHNMIVEDERITYLNYQDPTEFMEDRPTQNDSQNEDVEETDDDTYVFSTEKIASLKRYMINRTQLRDKQAHNALQTDLIEHMWQKFGYDN